MIRLEPLTGRHDRKGFECGAQALDLWIRQTALQHQSKGLSRTFVAVPADEAATRQFRQSGFTDIQDSSILGFYALTATLVVIEGLPQRFAKRFPRQIPATRLGRLAVRREMQGEGLGRLLLADAVIRSTQAAEAVGSAGILVDAKDAAAAAFYRHFGFEPCSSQPLRLFRAFTSGYTAPAV